MKIVYYFLIILFFGLVSCSKKVVPESTKTPAPTETVPKKVRVQAPPKTASTKNITKVITVNDAAAKRDVDGRLYYDLDGHRYWKNYRTGKYYLFEKWMYDSKDFQPPK